MCLATHAGALDRCNGYVAGGNTRFFGERKGSKAFKPQDIVQDIEDRLAFTDQDTGDYGSMLAFACPYDDGENRDQVISISHRLLPWEVTAPKTTQKTYFPGGPAHHAVYSQLYQLGNIHFGEDIQAAEREFISQACEQRAVLRGPAPRLLAVVADALRVAAGAGPLRTQLPRIRHPCPSVALAQQLTPSHLRVFTGSRRASGGAHAPLPQFCNSHSLLTLHLA